MDPKTNIEKVKNRIDYTFLMEVLAVQSSPLDESRMLEYIKKKLTELDVIVEEDSFGNIYVTKGETSIYPLLVAHTDTVHPIVSKYHLFRSEDILFAFNPTVMKQTGIGGDDKVGVFILLQALVDIPAMKAVFYRQEEVGCKGSRYSILNHKSWYDDCGYIIEPDRRGSTDVITNSGGIDITSQPFVDDIMPLMEKYGYSESVGIYTDVDTLVTYEVGISAINFSCGYHRPHSDQETVSISQVNTCYNLIFDIVISNPNKKYSHIPVIKPVVTTYKTKGNRIETYIEQASPTYGISSPVKARQLKVFPPIVFEHYGNRVEFDNFMEYDVLKDNKKVYRYTGIKALPLTESAHCPQCKADVLETVFYLPYEGRMYCAKCNDYVDDTKVQSLLKYLEIDDNDVTFVHSVYSQGWLDKDNAIWSDKLQSWISDDLPFN
jgi:tripeptide aminopeptidase